MTKQVALSNDAYAALKREKRTGESFSKVVLRLLRSKNRHRNDVERFANRPRSLTMSAEEHLKMVEQDRANDRPDPWDAHAGP